MLVWLSIALGAVCSGVQSGKWEAETDFNTAATMIHCHHMWGITKGAPPVLSTLDTGNQAVVLVLSTKQKEVARYVMRNRLWVDTSLDLEALEEAIVALPKGVARSFREEWSAALATGDETFAGYGPIEKQVYFYAPLIAISEHRRLEAELAPVWDNRANLAAEEAEVAVVEAQATPKMLAAVRALRAEYVTACVASGGVARQCLGDKRGLALTHAILLLAQDVASSEVVAAEQALASNVVVYSDWNSVVHAATMTSFYEEKTKAEAWKEAKKRGLNDKIVLSKYGPEPESFLNRSPTWRPQHMAFQRSSRGQHIQKHWTVVEQIVRIDVDWVELRFPDRIVRSQSESNCRETGRVDSISQYGDVTYRTICSGPVRVSEENRGIAPLRVPAADALHLTPGSMATIWVQTETRVGRVGKVKRDGEVVAYGAFPW